MDIRCQCVVVFSTDIHIHNGKQPHRYEELMEEEEEKEQSQTYRKLTEEILPIATQDSSKDSKQGQLRR